MKYDVGNIYVGNWIVDRKNGMGKLLCYHPKYLTLPYIYEGEFKDDHPNGVGCLTVSTGETFRGTFVEGYPMGYCVNQLIDGTIIEGRG